jgi:GNAT superfamily N-acetyltransferase/predicted RNA binding protein YcfA (HicA-like mRNA interferase family)
MPAPRIPRGMARLIDGRVDDVFDRLLVRLLGHAFTGKHLYVEFEHGLTLPGIFEAAVQGEGASYADRDLLLGIAEVAKDYLDKHRAEAKAATKRRIQSLLYDVEQGNIQPQHFRNHVERELSELWARVRNGIERVVETEAQHAQTIGVKEGIDQVNTNLGIEDPTICFIPVKDDKLCDECRRLHMLPDGVTPKVWKSSEVSTEYHERGEDRPSWHLMHPHCRCALTTIMPGFGFKAGRITFIAFGHDEWQHQRGMQKSEAEDGTLAKMAVADLAPGQPLTEPEPWHGQFYEGMKHKPSNPKFMRQTWDYSHFLSPEHQAKGLRLHVQHVWRQANGDASGEIRAHLFDGDTHLGGMVGCVTGSGQSIEPHADDDLRPDYRGQGLGRAMYEAVYRHALSKGITAVSGGQHTPAARRVHESLARRHGMDYQPAEREGAGGGSYAYAIKSEAEAGDALEKALRWRELEPMLTAHGWAFQREGGDHRIYAHATIPRTLAIKHEHMHGEVSNFWVGKYAKDAGLRPVGDGRTLAPNPAHEYAPHYRAMGLLAGEPERKTWTPEEPHEHLAVEAVEPVVPPEQLLPHKLAHLRMQQQKGKTWPAVKAMKYGGKVMPLDDKDEHLLAAAKQAGMTHVPVQVVESDETAAA